MQKVSDSPHLTRLVDPTYYRKRLLVFFGGNSAVFILGFLLFLLTFQPSRFGSVDPRKVYALFLLAPILFLLGLLLLLLVKLSLRRMQFLDVAVLFSFFVSWSFFASISKYPDFLSAVFGIVLIWNSLLVPSRPRLQAALGISALLAFIVGKTLGSSLSISGLWESLLAPGFELAIWGLFSCYISYSLWQSRASLFAAECLGNYQIIRELGTGGMGKVYEATQAYLCRPTAIKVMQVPINGDAENAIARFEQEIKLSSTLTHPNTITIFDYGRADENTFFYSMEMLNGLDLQKLVARFGPLPASRAIYILLQATGALAEAHDKGIIHRDVKPSNIFLANQGGYYDFAKLLDFGLAKEMKSAGKDLTETGELLGTPRYIAPETVSSKETIDRRTDIYMLGAVAYFMVSGKPPFDATSSIALMMEHVASVPPKPSEVSELKIPALLDDAILKCLAKKQADRFQTVQEFAATLKQVTVDEPWDQEKAESWWKLHFPSNGGGGQPSYDPISLKTIARFRKN